MDITIFKDKWLTKKNIILLAIVVILIIIAITLFVILQNTKKEKLKSNIIPWMNWIALWIYSEL